MEKSLTLSSDAESTAAGSYLESVLSPMFRSCTQTIKHLEGSSFYSRVVNAKLDIASGNLNTAGLSSSFMQIPTWLTHLQSMPVETRLRLQDHMKQSYPGFDLTGTATEKFFASLQVTSPQTLSSIAQLLLSLVSRFAQFTSISSDVLSGSLEILEAAYLRQEEQLRGEFANKAKVLGMKVERLEK